MNSEQRIVDLESRIAHMEQSIQTLSDELYAQQKLVEQLQGTCQYLREQLRTQSLQGTTPRPGDEIPPHY